MAPNVTKYVKVGGEGNPVSWEAYSHIHELYWKLFASWLEVGCFKMHKIPVLGIWQYEVLIIANSEAIDVLVYMWEATISANLVCVHRNQGDLCFGEIPQPVKSELKQQEKSEAQRTAYNWHQPLIQNPPYTTTEIDRTHYKARHDSHLDASLAGQWPCSNEHLQYETGIPRVLPLQITYSIQ